MIYSNMLGLFIGNIIAVLLLNWIGWRGSERKPLREVLERGVVQGALAAFLTWLLYTFIIR